MSCLNVRTIYVWLYNAISMSQHSGIETRKEYSENVLLKTKRGVNFLNHKVTAGYKIIVSITMAMCMYDCWGATYNIATIKCLRSESVTWGCWSVLGSGPLQCWFRLWWQLPYGSPQVLHTGLEVSIEHIPHTSVYAITIHLLQTVPHPGSDYITLTHHAQNMELLRIEFERIDNGDEFVYSLVPSILPWFYVWFE